MTKQMIEGITKMLETMRGVGAGSLTITLSDGKWHGEFEAEPKDTNMFCVIEDQDSPEAVVAELVKQSETPLEDEDNEDNEDN